MITSNITNAIYQLYPNVVRTVGDIAYDAQGNEVSYDLAAVTAQAQKDDCKAQASALLYATDWTTIPDVANTANNPYLTNQAQFIAWRSQIRELAVNPIVNPTFPTQPVPTWS
jgi:acyl-CoA thioesterase